MIEESGKGGRKLKSNKSTKTIFFFFFEKVLWTCPYAISGQKTYTMMPNDWSIQEPVFYAPPVFVVRCPPLPLPTSPPYHLLFFPFCRLCRHARQCTVGHLLSRRRGAFGMADNMKKSERRTCCQREYVQELSAWEEIRIVSGRAARYDMTMGELRDTGGVAWLGCSGTLPVIEFISPRA